MPIIKFKYFLDINVHSGIAGIIVSGSCHKDSAFLDYYFSTGSGPSSYTGASPNPITLQIGPRKNPVG